MIEAPATTATASGVERLVSAVDRFFPLLWIACYLLLPVSGWASTMFAYWFDQRRDLAALRSVIADGRADVIADNGIGPAYIGVAALIHTVFGLSPEDSLVVLNRTAYALSVACGAILVGALVRRLVGAPPLVSLGAQFAFVAFVFAAGTWHWSDVPWSHFFAAFLAAAIYALRFAPARPSAVQAMGIGVAFALLALTRSFELVSVLAAWGIALAVLAAFRLSGPRLWRVAHLAYGVGAFALTAVAVHVATGKRGLFFLYRNDLDYQVAEMPTFSLSLVPTKIVQLFVEPCYYSMCELSDYTVGGGSNEDLWSLPLAVQLPSLVLLPLCVVAVALLVVWFARRRAVASGRVRELRVLIEMTVAATGIVVGYLASTTTGAAHLRYGFARDFLLPALLAAIVAVTLASSGLWLLLTRMRRSGRLSPEFSFVVLAVVGATVIVAVAILGRSHGLPRIESRQLGPVSYTASCVGDLCDVSRTVKTRAGREISIPEPSTLTFGCGDNRPRFTVYVTSLQERVSVGSTCRDPRLVAAWPTVMGLPPGRPELRAVAVENVRLLG